MRIVMDDAGDIPADLAQKYNIRVVPINIMFGTEEYLSGVTMDHAAFYDKVEKVTGANFPKTSQPTPYQMAEVYREILAQGETEILTVTVSDKLSGTYASAVAAAQELDGQGTFYTFDSQGGSAAQGYMALAAARMAEEGRPGDEILEYLAKMRAEMAVIFTIDSLEFAVKGGRVSSMKSMMASLLNIKPILQLKDGLIVEAGKVRTRKRAVESIVAMIHEKMGNRPVKLAILHANAAADAAMLAEQARAKLNATEEILVDMTIPVAINLGPGALGIAAIPD